MCAKLVTILDTKRAHNGNKTAANRQQSWSNTVAMSGKNSLQNGNENGNKMDKMCVNLVTILDTTWLQNGKKTATKRLQCT